MGSRMPGSFHQMRPATGVSEEPHPVQVCQRDSAAPRVMPFIPFGMDVSSLRQGVGSPLSH